MKTKFKLGEIDIEVTQKEIKNIHLSVNPPDGNVRVSAPIDCKIDSIRAFTLSRLTWIKEQKKKYVAQERFSELEFVSRESHYIWGKRYMLLIEEVDNIAPSIVLNGNKLVVRVKAHTTQSKIQDFIEQWYREILREEISLFIKMWEPVLSVKIQNIFIQQMKTKWGGCNIETNSLRFNSELIKKPRELLEYVIVHEMIHLIEPTHNTTFASLMDRYLPSWNDLKRQLNQTILPELDQNL